MKMSFYRLNQLAAVVTLLSMLAPAFVLRAEGGWAGKSLTEDQKILHVLNRLGFGARPGDLEKVRAGTKAIFVWGGCDYRDAFQNPRRFIFRDMMSGREDAANGWALKPHPMGYEGN